MKNLIVSVLYTLAAFAVPSLFLIFYLSFSNKQRKRRSEKMESLAINNQLNFVNHSSTLKKFLDNNQLTLFNGGNVANIFTFEVCKHEVLLFDYEFDDLGQNSYSLSGLLIRFVGQEFPYFKLRVQESFEKNSVKTLSLSSNGKSISWKSVPHWLRNIVHAYAKRGTHKQVCDFLNGHRSIEQLIVKSSFSGLCGYKDVVILYNYGFINASKEQITDKKVVAEKLIQIFDQNTIKPCN